MFISNISVEYKSPVNNSNIGAIICHTPKSIYEYEDESGDIKTMTAPCCKLISNTEELNNYFGDPFINPSVYSDLVLIYDLIKQGIPVRISSVDDILVNDDGFNRIKYNGYTEFYFKDTDGFNFVGYKLKSDIKFCQPIISDLELTNENNRLHIYVNLYYLDRSRIKDISELNKLNESNLYKILHFTYNVNEVSDDILISDFYENGLELQVIYQDETNKVLTSELLNRAKNTFKVSLNSTASKHISDKIITKQYEYNIHSSDYRYNLSDDKTSLDAYYNAIKSISGLHPEPIMLCLGRMFKTNDIIKDNQIVSQELKQLSADIHFEIINILLEHFNEECNTYLFVNMPDLSVSSAIKLLSQSSNVENETYLPSRFNCDIFFGNAVDHIESTLINKYISIVTYSAALLSFYNLIITNKMYMTNNFIDLNISNKCIKLVLSEKSAEKLMNNRCNSIVLFDIGRPSTFGDRSLSYSPNLQYSHISRNFVRVRRLIREYLETKKFMLNTLYNIDACISYIRTVILDDFVSSGVLLDYTISNTSSEKTVYINIKLMFASIAESIELNFTI